jgi:hypothetical protein
MTSLVDHIEKMPTSPVDWRWHGGFHDIPLNGWIRVAGRRYYYRVLDAFSYYPLYTVWNIPRDLRAPHMIAHRRWRHLVGWHCDRRPGEPKLFFSSEEKPDWKSYYDDPRPAPKIDFDHEGVTCRGITDLNEVRWLNPLTGPWSRLDPEDM